MMLAILIVAMTLVTLLSSFFIRRIEGQKSDQILLLLCETGERNLDYYFNSVQQSVARVASYAGSDLGGLSEEDLEQNIENVRQYFDEVASRTSGVLTYYYRIDPEVSDTVKGFWYTNLTGDGFKEHEVTDITLYDVEDTSKLVWFTVPKHDGEPIWLAPYITDNLGARVISYNAPIYWRGQFIGVVGIEIDYATMAEQVDSIRLYNNGYAFLSDSDGNLFYHPRIDVTQLTPETTPTLPEGAYGTSTFLRYNFEGVDKRAAWLPLSNGMRINVTAPVSETESDWNKLKWSILIAYLVILTAASLVSILYTRSITGSYELPEGKDEQVNNSSYDNPPEYNRDDKRGD